MRKPFTDVPDGLPGKGYLFKDITKLGEACNLRKVTINSQGIGVQPGDELIHLKGFTNFAGHSSGVADCKLKSWIKFLVHAENYAGKAISPATTT